MVHRLETGPGASFESPAYVLCRYWRFVGDDIASDEVRNDQADTFLGGHSPIRSNRAYKYSTLADLYRYAIARGLATRSPLPAKAPKLPPTAPLSIYSHDIYLHDELRRLLNATTTYRKRVNQLEPHTFRAFLLLLYAAGLRRREALRLTLAGAGAASSPGRPTLLTGRWPVREQPCCSEAGSGAQRPPPSRRLISRLRRRLPARS